MKKPKTETEEKKKMKKIKEEVSLNSGAAGKDEYRTKLKKIEEIYREYVRRYSELEQERNKLFSDFVKKIEQKKIEILRRKIDL